MDNNMFANNNSEEGEQCFLGGDGEELLPAQEDLGLDLPRRIKDQLPANELRTVRRPDNMAPRTFFLDSPRTLLLEALDRPCFELPPPPADSSRLKLRIVNSKNLSLEEYFGRERFRCLYNKLEAARGDNKTFLGRLKGIDSLVDYNWKNFRELQPPASAGNAEDRLDGDFQSGNLCRAYQGGQQWEYYLLVENDVNTHGYNNWFFFRCTSRGKGIRRFTLVNLAKKTSFFGQGMAISIFSRKRWEREGTGWFKGGQKITFGSINFLRPHHENEYYSCLSFEYQFAQEEDEVFFALNQPYTYSRLVRCLHTLSEQRKAHIQVKSIGYSIANNIIPTVKIAKHPSNNVVLVIARQHPCETTGSFIAENLIKLLAAEAGEVEKELLKQFQFIIVPMVNPDGVIHGTSRCNMAGLDLNRQWGEDTLKQLSPQVMKVKNLIASLPKGKRIRYMVDLHGHGKKYLLYKHRLSSFFFCCGSEKQHYRLLSLAMRKLEKRFSLAECTYGISRDKENTIRSKINSMGIGHSYTLETSLYGWRNPQGEIKHFNQYDYEQIAHSLLKSIFLLEAPHKLTQNLLGTTREMLLTELGSLLDLQEKDDKSLADNTELLSESDPEGDRLDVKDLLSKCQNKALKKKLQELQRRKGKKKGKLTDRNNSKNMRQSCPTGFYSGKLSSALGRELIVKLQVKSNAKKVSFSEKWQVRRQKIQQKLRSESVQREMAQTASTMASKPPRTRIKSQVSAFVERRIGTGAGQGVTASATAKHVLKKKPLPQKMRTEFREAEELMLSQQEIKQSQSRKSALQLRFKELRQESLNVILTDTLSISKMVPPQKEKERLHHQHAHPNTNSQNLSNASYSHPQRSIKNMAVHSKADCMPSDAVPKYSVKAEPVQSFEKTQQYKKFKQFLLAGQSPSKKQEKSINSVFYYFPVL